MITFFAGLALLVAGGAAALVPSSRSRRAAWTQGVFLVAGGGLALWPAVGTLLGRSVSPVSFEAAIAGGPWRFGLDPLAAWFVLVVFGVGVPIALFGIGYFNQQRPHGSARLSHGWFALLLVAMGLVVTARAAVPFLIAWEIMALSAYLLVVFEDREAEVRRAGLVYLVATHAGTLLLFVMFAVWGASAADLTFDSLARARELDDVRPAILLLALVGFGLKAGVVPLHFWLPEAHSAAPTHVSAIMSGVVIKMGIYGLLRVVSLVSAPAWWGWIVFLLGLISGVLGVVWALAQHDLKRLLAYHSVENIGIILMGLGLGALGLTHDAPVVAALGFGGALLHTANHALFKGLLFLGAGAVANATGTREIDLLGGVGRAMPFTWVLFLIGSAAIAGLPPLNGFVSEWLVFQGMFRGALAEGSMRLVVFGVAGLALVGGLALACFAKVGGVVFLGHPRSAHAMARGESPVGLLLPMAWLALGCVVIGVFPQLVLPVLQRVTGGLTGGGPAHLAAVVGAAGKVSALGAVLFIFVAAGWLALRRVVRRRRRSTAETWGCGYALPDARMQYTASSFAAPLLGTFGRITGLVPTREAAALHTRAENLVLDRLLRPSWRAVRDAAREFRPLHQGRLQQYVLYIVGTVLALLLYLMFRGEP